MNCNILELQRTSGTKAVNSNVHNVERAWQPASLDEEGSLTACPQTGSMHKVEAWMAMPLMLLGVLTELASITIKRSWPPEEVTDNPPQKTNITSIFKNKCTGSYRLVSFKVCLVVL